jgi:AraC family transcriptional regulator of arabinose operon
MNSTPQKCIANGLLGHVWYYLANMAEAINFLFGQFLPQCTHRVSKHFDYNVLQLCDGGAVELVIDGRPHRLTGRTFWSSYPGPLIRFNPAPGTKTWVHRYLAFSGPGVARWRAGGLFPVDPQPVDVRSDFPQRFDQMLELSRRPDRFGIARATLMLETILTELAEARARPNVLPKWIEPVLAAAQRFGAGVDQARLATEAGMSPRTFRRQFQAVMGTSAGEYVISTRINHAKELLGMTQLPIKQIAEQLGYRDVSFFTRQFRKVAGVAPAAYRRTREV